MSTITPDRAAIESQPLEGPRDLKSTPTPVDRRFRGVLRVSGLAVLVIMTCVGVFLAFRAAQALQVAGFTFLTTQDWNPEGGRGSFGIAAVIPGTILIALVAIFFSFPLASGTALYISEYAPQRIKQTLISLVDLMAAVPSIVFGLWGFLLFQYQIIGVSRWISTYFGWIPIFRVEGTDISDPLASTTVFTSSTFIAGIVVCLMVTPIATSVMREVFSQAPAGEREGAYALGATKWGMIRSVVLPYGRGGMIGATMLGLGRALGETIAVYLILSLTFAFQPRILENGGSSVSALIAVRFGDSTPFGLSALMAAGLALFLMTLVINFGAGYVVARSRSGAEDG